MNANAAELARLEAALESTHTAMNIAWAGGWLHLQDSALLKAATDAYQAAHRAWWIASRTR